MVFPYNFPPQRYPSSIDRALDGRQDLGSISNPTVGLSVTLSNPLHLFVPQFPYINTY